MAQSLRRPVQLSCLLLQPTRPLQQEVELEAGSEKHAITMEDLISPVPANSIHMHRPHFLTFSPGPSTRRASRIAYTSLPILTQGTTVIGLSKMLKRTAEVQ